MRDKDIFKDDYSKVLKLAMVENGIKTQELANKTGYSYEGVRQIVKGNGSYWGVFKVCKALNVDYKSLIRETT